MSPTHRFVWGTMALGLVASGGTAFAEEAPAEVPPVNELVAEVAPPRTYVGLRGGATTAARRPELCLEVNPLPFVALEACGTGSGFLHQDPDPETAHFRASFRAYKWKTSFGQVEALVGAGFAEVQVGEDDAGFHFTGVGPRGAETAGPEVAATLRTLIPVGAGFELLGNATLGALWAPHAGELVRPQPTSQVFGSITIGVGF